MKRAHRGLWLAGALLVSACAPVTPAPAPPVPTQEAPPQEAPGEEGAAPQAQASQEPAPLPEDLPELVPEGIEAAQDDVSRAFACMEYNHVTLLSDTDLRDGAQVVRRLGELKTARPICEPLMEQLFSKFPPFLESFRHEWSFYLRYFALTLDTSAVHNLQTFCGRLGGTLESAQQAQRSAEIYQRWLSSAVEGSQAPDPYLKTMLTRATEKVTVLTTVTAALEKQQQRDCP